MVLNCWKLNQHFSEGCVQHHLLKRIQCFHLLRVRNVIQECFYKKFFFFYNGRKKIGNKFIFSADELEEDMEIVEELAQQVYSKHSSLLGKGFALANPLTINQALDGVLPYRQIRSLLGFYLVFFFFSAASYKQCLLHLKKSRCSYHEPKYEVLPTKLLFLQISF